MICCQAALLVSPKVCLPAFDCDSTMYNRVPVMLVNNGRHLTRTPPAGDVSITEGASRISGIPEITKIWILTITKNVENSGIWRWNPSWCILEYCPVWHRIKYMTAILAKDCVHGNDPAYFSSICTPVTVAPYDPWNTTETGRAELPYGVEFTLIPTQIFLWELPTILKKTINTFMFRHAYMTYHPLRPIEEWTYSITYKPPTLNFYNLITIQLLFQLLFNWGTASQLFQKDV